MNEVAKFFGFFLSFISISLTITTIALPDWRVNDVEGEVVELIKRTQGLWVKCAFFPTGNWQCEDYDRFFIALPGAITGARVFSILALIFQLVAICAQPMGMMCTTLVHPQQTQLKAKITLACGALSLVSAVCIGVAVSWYAALVVEDYSRFTTGMSAGVETSVQRFIYGKALYMGWAAMSVLVIQGFMLCCSSWSHEEDGYNYAGGQDYNTGYGSGYNAPKSQMQFGMNPAGSHHNGHGGGHNGGQQYI